MNYHKPSVKVSSYFFTVTTQDRQPFLCMIDHVSLLGEAFRSAMKQHPFEVDAFVLLPDHLHCVWTLPEGDNDISTRWELIKTYFNQFCNLQEQVKVITSKKKKAERTAWHDRTSNQQLKDEAELTQHIEYIHYDPVRHGLVDVPKDWQHSSFQRYVRNGFYDVNWGADGDVKFTLNYEN